MIVYTVRGGASAVIWTDVVQLFVYIAGAAVVFVSLLALIPGGWAEVVRAGARGRASSASSIFSLTLSRPYTFWAGVIGGVALTLATHGTDQFLVQRLLAARSSREAARGLVLSGFLVFAQFVLFLVIGVMLFTYYQHVPLPRAARRATTSCCPTFIVTALTHGAAGFIVAAIVAAALSPSLNAMAATTVNDFYVKYSGPTPTSATLMRVSRMWTVIWGVVQIGVAIARAVDAAVGARRRPRRAVVRVGPVLGAFLLGTLRAVGARRRGVRRHAGGLVVMTVVWGWTTHRVHLVRVHRRVDDGGVAWLASLAQRDRTARAGPAEMTDPAARARRARPTRSPPDVFPAAAVEVGSSAAASGTRPSAR